MHIDASLPHPAAVGFEPGRPVVRRATSSCACFPTYRTNWPTTVSAFSLWDLRITSNGTLRHSMSHICTPAEICPAPLLRATCGPLVFLICLPPTERRRIWSDAAPQSGCSTLSWASELRTAPPESLRLPTPNAGNWRGWVYRKSVCALCQTL